MLYTEQMLNAKLALETEVQNTRRLARRVCLAYQKKVLFAAVDKSKLLYLTYCLIALIIMLIVFGVFLRI